MTANNLNSRDETSLCRCCTHFFITHQPAFPYGCRAMDFKSRRLPEEAVRSALADLPCQSFTAKPVRRSKEER